MTRMRLARICMITLSCIALAMLAGQSAYAATASISLSGQVTDLDHKPVDNATISLYFNNTLVSLSGNPATTDASGRYKINGIASSVYSVQVAKNDYTYSETLMTNDTDIVRNFALPGHTAALVTTPSPRPTLSPTPTPSPTATPCPTPCLTPSSRPTSPPSTTSSSSPGFEVLIALAGLGLAVVTRKN